MNSAFFIKKGVPAGYFLSIDAVDDSGPVPYLIKVHQARSIGGEIQEITEFERDDLPIEIELESGNAYHGITEIIFPTEAGAGQSTTVVVTSQILKQDKLTVYGEPADFPVVDTDVMKFQQFFVQSKLGAD